MLSKRILLFMLLGLLVVASSACASDQDKLQKSLKKWEQLREKCQGNY